MRHRYRPEDLVDTVDAAVHIFRSYAIRIEPARIRQWAVRKHIQTYGRRRRRYRLDEVMMYAASQGLIPDPKIPTRGAKHG